MDDPIDPTEIDYLDDTECCCQCGGSDLTEDHTRREQFRDDTRGEINRRGLAGILATIGGLSAVSSLVAPLASLTRVFERKYTGPLYSEGVYLVDEEGEHISTGRLSDGDVITVFPEPHADADSAPTLLVRFPPDSYPDEVRERTAEGYAAFSKVCTHAGCMVSNVENTTLVCPCHSGKFNPIEGAAVTGGPPPRPLPQLPLAVDGDELVAQSDFEDPIGAGEG